MHLGRTVVYGKFLLGSGENRKFRNCRILIISNIRSHINIFKSYPKCLRVVFFNEIEFKNFWKNVQCTLHGQ